MSATGLAAKAAKIADRLFPKKPQRLELLRPAALDKARSQLKGGLGQASDFYRQVEQKAGKGAAALYYPRAKGLGKTTRDEFASAYKPRKLRIQRGYAKGMNEDAINEATYDRLYESGASEDIMNEMARDRYGLDFSDLDRHEMDRIEDAFVDYVTESPEWDRAQERVIEQMEATGEGLGRRFDPWTGYQMLYQPTDEEYWEAALLDPSLLRSPSRSLLAEGAHYQNPFLLGHARGAVNLNSMRGGSLDIFELQSDPLEELGGLSGNVPDLPALRERLKTPHATVAKALLERAALDPDIGMLRIPTADAIMKLRGQGEGTRRAMSSIYDREVVDALSPYGLGPGADSNSDFWRVLELTPELRARLYEEGIPYKKGGRVPGGLRQCSCGGRA